MKRNTVVLLALFSALRAGFAFSPEEILERVDEHRSVALSFKFQLRIEDYSRGELVQSAVMSGFSSGLNKTMVQYDEPANMRGKKLLMVNDDLLIFIPKTQRPVRLTPSQRLLGQAANGDVMNIRFQADYEPLLSDGEILTVEGVQRDCVILDMKARRKSTAYSRMVLWVEKETFLPVKAECYALSGKMLKSVEYSRVREFDGKKVVYRATIHDLVIADNFTIIEFLDMHSEEIPESYFNREYLLRM